MARCTAICSAVQSPRHHGRPSGRGHATHTTLAVPPVGQLGRVVVLLFVDASQKVEATASDAQLVQRTGRAAAAQRR